MGRSTRTDEITEAILDRLSEGEPLAVICRNRTAGMPSLRTVYDWMDADQEFAAKMQRARDAGEEAQAAKIIDIADEDPGKTANGVDAAEVQNRKLRIWARTQAMDRFNPKRRAERETDPGQAIVEMLAQLAGKLPG